MCFVFQFIVSYASLCVLLFFVPHVVHCCWFAILNASSLFEQFAPFFTIADVLLTSSECALSSFHSVVCIFVFFVIFCASCCALLLVGFQYVHAVPFTCVSYCSTFMSFELFEYHVSHGIQILSI